MSFVGLLIMHLVTAKVVMPPVISLMLLVPAVFIVEQTVLHVAAVSRWRLDRPGLHITLHILDACGYTLPPLGRSSLLVYNLPLLHDCLCKRRHLGQSF